MRIDNTGIRPRAERHAYQDKVDVRTSDGSQIETKAQDVSLSGMALSLSAPVIDNGAFVELHSESLGTVTGTVARTYDGGAAVQFTEPLEGLPAGTTGAYLNQNA